MSNNVNHHHHQSFGDTTLTKVFVGGLAWETPLEALRVHFEKYGEIMEAVIISDKLTGRSKGYGFVNFKDPESARKACADPSPVINGRLANCNLASLGARRPKPPPTATTPPPQGHNTGARAAMTPPANYGQWYYPTGAPPQAAAFHHRRHPHHQAVPFYGYSPAYIPTNVNYNPKLNYSGGANMNGHYPQLYPGQHVMLPVYPYYQFLRPTVGLPAHLYPSATVGPISTDPALIIKPKSIAPQAGNSSNVQIQFRWVLKKQLGGQRRTTEGLREGGKG